MENLDFGWGFAGMILLSYLLSYYFFSGIYYLGSIFIGSLIKKLLNHFDYYQIQKEGILKSLGILN